MNGGLKVIDIKNYEVNKPREIVGMVKMLDEKYKFEKVYLDETGAGEGPTDWLNETLDEERVEGLRFTLKSKMDIYSNLWRLMNSGKLKLPRHHKLISQMTDLRYELTGTGDMKIHHPERGHDDYPDALALACWALKENEVEEYESLFM
jgi:phage FluMu gp28-like protein